LGVLVSNYTTVAQISKLIFTTVMGYLIVLIGWRLSTNILGFSAFVIVVCVILYERQKYQDQIVIDEPKFKLSLNRKMAVALLSSMTDEIASSVVILYIPFLILAKGYDPIYIPAATTVMFVGAIIGKFFIGRLTDHKPEGLVFITTELIMAGLTLTITFLNNFYLILLVVLLLGIATKGTAPVTQIMVAKSANKEHGFRAAFTMDSFVCNVGAFCASIGFGLLGDKFGILSVFYAFSIVALLAVSFGFVYQRMGRTAD